MLGPVNNQGELAPFDRAAEEEALAVRLGPKRIVECWLDTYAEGVKHRLANSSASERASIWSSGRWPLSDVETVNRVRPIAAVTDCGSVTSSANGTARPPAAATVTTR